MAAWRPTTKRTAVWCWKVPGENSSNRVNAASASRFARSLKPTRTRSIPLLYATRDEAEAMDIAQEAFLKLFSVLPGFPRGDQFRIVALPPGGEQRLLPLVDGLLDLMRATGEGVLQR
jgi:hypothetical protein